MEIEEIKSLELESPIPEKIEQNIKIETVFKRKWVVNTYYATKQNKNRKHFWKKMTKISSSSLWFKHQQEIRFHYKLENTELISQIKTINDFLKKYPQYQYCYRCVFVLLKWIESELYAAIFSKNQHHFIEFCFCFFFRLFALRSKK